MTQTEQVGPEVGQEPAESQLPQVSGTSPGERGSSEDVNTKVLATLETLVERVGKLEAGQPTDERVEKLVQRFSDRRFHAVETLQDKVALLEPADIKLVADALRAAGGDPEKAADALGVQAILRERRSAARQPDPVSQTPQARSAPADGMVGEDGFRARAEKVLSKSGLSDEEKKGVYAEWSKGKYTSHDDALTDLAALAITVKAPAQQPAPLPTVPQAAAEAPAVGAGAALPSGVGSTAASAEDKAIRVAGLYDKLGSLYKEPTKNAKAIAETEAGLRELGEEISSKPTF